jgi:glyoxylase I family protein
MFKRIDHIELLTAAPERAVAFYVDVLGFRESTRMRIPQTPIGPRNPEPQPGWQCLALEVEGMDRALDMLEARGVRTAWGPVKRTDHARAEIRDPDGNPIELRQWYCNPG